MPELKKRLGFRMEGKWDGRTGVIMTTSKGKTLHIDTPEEFDGFGTAPCPDELFLASIAGCVLTTFLWFSRRRDVEISDLKLKAQSEIELEREGYSFKGIKVSLEVKVPVGCMEKAEKCLDLAIKYCHISKGVKPCIPLEIEGRVSSN